MFDLFQITQSSVVYALSSLTPISKMTFLLKKSPTFKNVYRKKLVKRSTSTVLTKLVSSSFSSASFEFSLSSSFFSVFLTLYF
ncbi:hypothetical protein MNV_1140047 [Candidatus Methanoperedens nitroreducens]|uniref:Uncharacterized protein n=1 Tax=Candidatus Methanoperedens nitratireducens TaxID=1392998 RepID=A0A284VJC5_9EURY|nr:hypothetical protein MNV_1140047 [Candidatus Methanoperedens nitroreducens]